MRTISFPLLLACTGIGAAQPYLFYNQGALVYVQQGALVYVQGGMQTNDNAGNNGVLENLGTIRLVDGAGGYQGHFYIGPGAEVNSRPNSDIFMQGNYHNNDGYHRSTGTYTAYGNTTLGGTVTFNGTQTQTFQVSVDATTGANSQNWTLNNVVVNNTATLIASRHVQIANHPTGGYDSDRDMWIAGTLTFTSGRIHTVGATLNGGAPAEVRVLNTAPSAVSRTPWPPDASNFTTLVPDNQDRYVYGYLRRNLVAANGTYPFAVGDAPAGPTPKGLQGIDVTAASDHYVRVFFEPTPVANASLPTYCRPGDPTPNYSYTALNNGRWRIEPFGTVDATTAGTQAGPARITMYNRVVTNAGSGTCPAAGTAPDDYWPGKPTDQCYVGFNADGTPAVRLVNPGNCEGSNTGFTVTRTGFTGAGYNTNGSVLFATAWTQNHPLPAEDIRLAAAPAGSALALTWTVSPEREYVLGYELYRSTDGVNFSRITQVDKQGRTTYHHRDLYVQPLTRYLYRVGQHDIFGNVRYSNTVEAMLPASEGAFSAQLQPNPILTEGYLIATTPAAGTLGLQLYDAAGRLVAQSYYDLQAGTHQIDLSPVLAQVAAGNYNALVSWGGETRTLRLIKADLSR